ncbi:F-box/LRR-repeat protein 3-like protein isoform X1 [Cinnamomum micranthum f. kanehirae]|uniref:F-box/LRR-repeat protein 3-like protein isoform X1 n=1 Tax=Cinnamomum micranthum f. kanehirae TaxID=337451 RepID=A0A3S3NG43_9MAGN|nr:F-box/LRR-repeat protein 3-like protein isoform X1 [Cinnamomum micranthum f. kanehirae]
MAVLSFSSSIFDLLTDEILFTILDFLAADSPLDLKSFSLVCKSFHAVESRHRKTLKPLRIDLLPSALRRYLSVSHVDLSLCPRVADCSLSAVAASLRSSLRSIDLSRSRSFTHAGIADLVSNCRFLVEMDLSNATDLTDCAAAAISRAVNLERLRMARCKMITDLGIGCVAVGCRKLKVISLRWCLGVTDFGVGLIAVKCKELKSLDVSYMQITKKCLPAILQLHNLEELVLAGCLGIDDEALATLKQGCKSLETLDVSNCPNVSHDGLSSLINGAVCLRQLILVNCTPVTHALATSLVKLPKLQVIKLDSCHVTCSGLKAIGKGCISLEELSLSKCSGVTDEGLSFLVTKHKGLKKLDITCCTKITDISVSSITSCSNLTSLKMESCSLVSKEAFVLIGQRCHLLEELDLTENEIDNEGFSIDLPFVNIKIQSVGITDCGIAAIAQGCPMLQIINLAYCKDISDDSLRSLSTCSRLNTLEIRGCARVSSVGLSLIAVGCKQIAKLDVKKCYHIDDAGMIPLAPLCQNLRQINLSYCSITDVGLLALASISCLQNMTILHLRGLSANGLAAALLACGSLTKVKLHVSFKSLLSQPLIHHMEARGCMFQWRDKPFQVEDMELKDAFNDYYA